MSWEAKRFGATNLSLVFGHDFTQCPKKKGRKRKKREGGRQRERERTETENETERERGRVCVDVGCVRTTRRADAHCVPPHLSLKHTTTMPHCCQWLPKNRIVGDRSVDGTGWPGMGFEFTRSCSESGGQSGKPERPHVVQMCRHAVGCNKNKHFTGLVHECAPLFSILGDRPIRGGAPNWDDDGGEFTSPHPPCLDTSHTLHLSLGPG